MTKTIEQYNEALVGKLFCRQMGNMFLDRYYIISGLKWERKNSVIRINLYQIANKSYFSMCFGLPEIEQLITQKHILSSTGRKITIS